MSKKNREQNSKLKNYREKLLISRAELARRADVALLTIVRIEAGEKCRFATMRKIIKALDLEISDKDKIF